MNLHGHFWTVAPHVAGRWNPPRLAGGSPFSASVPDPAWGRVRVRGVLHGTGRDLVVVVHGLGGAHDSAYVLRAAAAVRRAGGAVLRLSLRGACGSGEDIYHAGLIEDLVAALGHRALAGFERIALIGFSLGGHVVLRWALEPSCGRVQRVAAVCPPLDLSATRAALDQPRAWPYRRHVLSGLRAMYARVAAAGRGRTPLSAVRRVRTILEWDETVVVPRYGFESAAAYYARMSVGPHLARLQVPSAVVVARRDPMVPFATVGPSLAAAAGAPNLHPVVVERGGHVGFPRGLGLTGPKPSADLLDELVAWLLP